MLSSALSLTPILLLLPQPIPVPVKLYTEFQAEFIDPPQNTGADGTGNYTNLLILLFFPVYKSKRLLKYHGILVRWITIGAKTEISQTVNDIFSLIFVDSLEHMGMVPYHKIRSPINTLFSQDLLVILRAVFPLHSPVAAHQDQVCALLLQFGDPFLYGILGTLH